ncbi:hypothetical protein ACMC5R_05450 [Deferribacteres bacterium DY0037]
MSKLNQIQNAIIELEGGAFQKLADQYLVKKGYANIIPTGSVAGNNKVKKGTPDTLFQQSSGKYIFVEYTTQKTNVYAKLLGDINKCLDEKKTGIALHQIEAIVLCYTSDLNAAEIFKLAEKCKQSGANLSWYGLGTLSSELATYYPQLAKDHLGIEIDTGQIVQIADFIDQYDKCKTTTPLKTSFHFRSTEVEKVLEALNHSNMVIVSGKPGIGKSRLAIECLEQFKKQNGNYKVFCIINKGPDMFDDVKAYFSEPGEFLILIDDARGGPHILYSF